MRSDMPRRGNAAITALTLLPLLGFSALSVDIGLQRLVNAQLAGAVDAAALGGAMQLDGTADGVAAAIDRAVSVAAANHVYGGWTLSPDEVVPGVWDGTTLTEADPVKDATRINAIRVQSSTWFSAVLAPAVFGVRFLAAGASSVALRPTGGVAHSVPCYLPFALPDCHFRGFPEGATPRLSFVMNTSTDTLGWALPDTVNTGAIQQQLVDSCGGGKVEVGDPLKLGNGRMDAAVHLIRAIINASAGETGATWPEDDIATTLGWAPTPGGPDANPIDVSDIDPGRWGWTLAGPVPLIDLGPDCSDLDFSAGDAPITGFTYAYVYDLNDGGAGDKNLWFQFDFATPYELGTGDDRDAIGNMVGTTPAVLIP